MKQSALNRFRSKFLTILKIKWKDLPNQCLRLKQAKQKAEEFYLKFELQEFYGNDSLHPKGRHAAQCVYCDSPESLRDTVIFRFKCAKDK